MTHFLPQYISFLSSCHAKGVLWRELKGAIPAIIPFRRQLHPLWFFAQTFVIGLDLYIVSPLLPAISRQYHQPPSMVSLLVTIFALTYAISSPVWGIFADHYTRRRLALLGLLLFLGGDLLTALEPPFRYLLWSRAIAAVGAAGFTPSLYAYIADTTFIHHRGRTMSIASAGFSSATFLGIPLGLIIADVWTWSTAFWLIFVLALLSWGITWKFWTVSKHDIVPQNPSICPDSRLAVNYIVTALAYAGFGAVYTYLPLDLTQSYHFSPLRLTVFMMAFGLFGLLGTLGAGYLSDRVGHLRVIRWALLAETLLLLGLRHPWTGAILWLGLLLFSLVTSYTPVLKALVSAKGAKGLALSWNNAAMYFGLSLGALGMGMLWPYGMTTIYLSATIFTTLAYVMTLRL